MTDEAPEERPVSPAKALRGSAKPPVVQNDERPSIEEHIAEGCGDD